MNKVFAFVLLALISWMSPLKGDINFQKINWEQRATSTGGLAMNGYDPVSYFNSGPKLGKNYIRAIHKGVSYHFFSHSNRSEFIKNPEKFEPACGGYCAYAMIMGERIHPNPLSYKIIDGKNHLFYKTHRVSALDVWDRRSERSSEQKLLATLERQWAKINR